MLQALWSEGPTTFNGEHYVIDDLDGSPEPFTTGGPPLLIAGGGKRMLRFAAQHADIIGVNVALASTPTDASARDGLPASIDSKFEQIRADAGDRFDQLEFNAWLSVCRVTDDALALGERLSARFGAPAEEVLRSPFILAGTLDELIDRLEERRARWGYSYFVVQEPSIDEFAPIVASLSGR